MGDKLSRALMLTTALLALVSQGALAQSLEGTPSSGGAMAESSSPGTLPSLPELFNRALRHDNQVARQRYELEATEQEVPMARAQLLPQLSASGGYQWQDSTNIQTDPEGFGLDQPAQRPGTFDEHYWRLSLQQPLFSMERWRGLNRAVAEVSAAELDLAIAERDLALEVSDAYMSAYLASRSLGLLEAQQEALELQVRQAQRAYDLGVGDRINLLEARSRHDQAIADAVQAENRLDDALGELERLTGILPDFSGSVLGKLAVEGVDEEWGNEVAWLEAVGNNLDILRALAEHRIADSDTRVRRGGYYPELNLNISYSDRHSDDELRASEDYTASVELSVPLYRGGYTTASVRQGDLRSRARLEGAEHARNLAEQQVRQRLRALRGGWRRLEALSHAIDSGELFLEAAERGEQLGLRGLVDVLDARATLYDQRIQYVETLGQLLLDRLALQSAVGELESRDLESIMELLGSATVQ